MSEVISGNLYGNYRTNACLGVGGQGAVWSATDLFLSREVAIKFLRLEGDDREAARRFYNEYKIGARLNHTNIARVIEIFAHPPYLIMVMDLVKGMPLSDLLAAGKLKPRRALEIARSVADATGHAHAMGILHRDLKPRNIMILDDGGVVVLDWGIALAQDISRLTPAGLVLGTPTHMSPEAINGNPPDARTDIWAAGIVLYESLTGKPAFQGNELEVLGRVLYHQPPGPHVLNPDVSPTISVLTMKMLQKDPAARFQSMREVVAAIDAELSPAPEPVTTRSVRPTHKAKWIAAFATTVIGFALAARALSHIPASVRPAVLSRPDKTVTPPSPTPPPRISDDVAPGTETNQPNTPLKLPNHPRPAVRKPGKHRTPRRRTAPFRAHRGPADRRTKSRP